MRPTDLRGEVAQAIPKLGIPILFLQSQPGFVFAIIALSLLSLFLYWSEIRRGGGWVWRGIFSPLLEENRRRSQVLEWRMENTEQTLAKFTEAVDTYGEHLKSHTSILQSMSEASMELRNWASEQDVVMSRLTEVLEKSVSSREVPRVEQVVPRIEVVCPWPQRVVPRAEPVAVEMEETRYPPGCIRGSQPIVRREKILAAS